MLHTNLDDGSDELLHEIIFEQVRPVVVDKVDDEALDVGAVLVLVGHDHEMAVAESPEGGLISVLLAKLQPQDLYKVNDLLVCHQLEGGGRRELVERAEGKGWVRTKVRLYSSLTDYSMSTSKHCSTNQNRHVKVDVVISYSSFQSQ